MSDELTCGTGLAEQAALPAKLAELTASLAKVLEVHQKSLVLSDPDARLEQEAYAKLARQHREVAARLQAAANQMGEYRDLPAAKHDESAVAGLVSVEAFEQFVNVEQDLLTLLQDAVTEGRKMLAAMRG